MIPRIIHQTWKTTEIPPEWLYAHHSWRLYHPEWSHRLWTDRDNHQLVAAHYPQLSEWYDALPYGILKADVARVLILDHCGGIYSDLDTECLRPLDPLLANASMVIGLEPRGHARHLGQRRVLSNAVLAASARHPFLQHVIEAFETLPRNIETHRDVLEQTGPLLFSRLFAAHHHQDVTILAPEVFYPLQSNDTRLGTLRNRQEGFEEVRQQCISAGGYVVHYWSNSWTPTLAGELFNPYPHHVPGFRFYPGMDSTGFDIRNGGRDIPKLAGECLEDEATVGFNTDGFLKSHIRPKSSWQRMMSLGDANGLYIKDGVKVRDATWGKRLARCWLEAKRMLTPS